MSSAPSAPSSSRSTASPPPSVPVGVRTDAVVPGRWVAAALIAAVALAVVVFFLLPTRLPSGPAVTSRDALPPAPRAESPKGDPAESVRLRLLAEEAASRYRAGSAALRERGAAAWAPEALNAAAGLADEAAKAASAGDHARAIKNYEEASRRLAAIAARAESAYARALADGEAAIQAGVAAKAIESFRLARTEMQRLIATIWQDVLQMEQVGIHDNFFDLGGHSLLMTKVWHTLRTRLHQDLAMLDLFQYPTIDALATHLSQEHRAQPAPQRADDRDDHMHAGKSRLKQQLLQRQRATSIPSGTRRSVSPISSTRPRGSAAMSASGIRLIRPVFHFS